MAAALTEGASKTMDHEIGDEEDKEDEDNGTTKRIKTN